MTSTRTVGTCDKATPNFCGTSLDSFCGTVTTTRTLINARTSSTSVCTTVNLLRSRRNGISRLRVGLPITNGRCHLIGTGHATFGICGIRCMLAAGLSATARVGVLR